MHKNNRLFSTLTAGYYLTWVKLMVVMAIISMVVSCGDDEVGVSPRVEVSPATPGQVGKIITSAGLTNIAVKWDAPTNFGVKSNYMTDVIWAEVVTNDGKVTTNVTTESVKRDVMYTITDIGYKVTISPSNANVFKQEIDLTNVSFAGLASNTSYTITVWATNPKASGPQTRKTQKTRATLANPPSAPVVTVSNGTPAQSSLVVNWSAPTDPGTNQTGVLATISGYLVAVSTNANPDGSGVVDRKQVTNLTSLSATFSNLTGDTRYYIAVFATNSADLHSMGVAIHTTASFAPGAVTIATVTTNANSVIVTWVAPVDTGKNPDGTPATITGYDVSINPSNSGVTMTGTGLTRSISGLTPNTAYTITVKAVNATGTGPGTATPVTTSAESAPGQVAIATVTTNANSVIVTWVAPVDTGKNPDGTSATITGYRVSIVLVAGNAAVPTATGTGLISTASTSTTIGGLTAGTAYTITVKAVNATGDGPGTATPVTTLP